ncbi:hypothetical protein J3F83DRAFT_747677 [Trichoderma novae-zelandiae]
MLLRPPLVTELFWWRVWMISDAAQARTGQTCVGLSMRHVALRLRTRLNDTSIRTTTTTMHRCRRNSCMRGGRGKGPEDGANGIWTDATEALGFSRCGESLLLLRLCLDH